MSSKWSIVAVSLLSTVFLGCQQYSTSPNSISHTALPSQVAASNTPPTPVPARGHFYLFEKNGEYVYPRSLEKEDPYASDLNQPHFIVHYLGQKNGQHLVMINSGTEVSVRVTCQGDCQTIKKENIFSEQSLGTDTVTAAGTVEGTIMLDAVAGRLKPYAAS